MQKKEFFNNQSADMTSLDTEETIKKIKELKELKNSKLTEKETEKLFTLKEIVKNGGYLTEEEMEIYKRLEEKMSSKQPVQ
ncbi:hypothetical protein KAI52_03260 [Candidatus Parcubacteria bacterium]|nr:hypothetical protein [Candidatus Parcubacteria bacterium]